MTEQSGAILLKQAVLVVAAELLSDAVVRLADALVATKSAAIAESSYNVDDRDVELVKWAQSTFDDESVERAALDAAVRRHIKGDTF